MKTSNDYFAHNEADTIRLAQQLAAWSEPGTMIALDGDLGAGKTRFSQAFAEAIGVTGVVNSPTFTIIKEYSGKRIPFYHMDVYRISLEEAEELGLDEYFDGEGVTVVEWSSRITSILPQHRLDIYIEHVGAQQRRFTLTAHGTPYTDWCRKLQEIGVIT